ncbi:HNH endonuclease [Paenibacillus xylanexedens]|uniref:HNH endonuclease n=1 Tax=Paenibacillus xylanexedens TaxID=528191 RepID=UPI001642B1D7|nr:HNH endonuclease [Paenibacillus xylanexedens]
MKNGRQKAWQRRNPDRLKVYSFYRYMHKTHDISNEEWELCKEYFNNSCAYCNLSLATHQKVNKQDLHKEHVDPNGSNDLANCVPSCRECNSSKKDKNMIEWYKTKDFYSITNLKKIEDWLKGDYVNHLRS